MDNVKQDSAACLGDDPDKAINGCTNLIRSTPDTAGVPDPNNPGSANTITIISSIATNPLIADAHIKRAFNYLKKDRFDDAINDCSRVIRFLPKESACYGIRAAALVGKKLIDNAMVDAEKGVSLAPNNADLLATRGQVYEKIGAREEAIADFRKAIQINPNQVSAQQGLARLGTP